MKDSSRLFAVFSVVLVAGCVSKMPAPVVERGEGPAVAASPAGEMYTVKRGDTLYSIAREHGIDHRDLIAWNSIESPNRIQVGTQLRVKPPAAAATGGVVAQPIGGAAAVEQRALDGGAPVAASPAPASLLKTEPKAGKLPYSEQNLALLQQRPAAAPAVAEERRETVPATSPESKPAPAEAAVTGPDDVAWIWPSAGRLLGQFSESGSKGIAIGGKAGDPVIAAGDGRVVYSGTGLRGYGKLIIIKHNAVFLSAYAHNQNLLVKEGQSVSRGQKIAEMGNTDSDQVKLHFEIRQQGKPVDPLKYLPQR